MIGGVVRLAIVRMAAVFCLLAGSPASADESRLDAKWVARLTGGPASATSRFLYAYFDSAKPSFELRDEVCGCRVGANRRFSIR